MKSSKTHLAGRVFFEQKQKIDSSWVFLLTTLSSPFLLTLCEFSVCLLTNQNATSISSLRALQRWHSLYKISRIWCTAYPTTRLNSWKWFVVCWLFSRWAAMTHTGVSDSIAMHSYRSLSLSLSLSLCCRLKLFWMNFLRTQTYNAERNNCRKYVCAGRLTFKAYFLHGYAKCVLEQL